MDHDKTNSVHWRVTSNYFLTTSVPSESTETNYRKKTRGLKRGLREWLDVENQVVLDLGCGTGELCWLARDLGAMSVTGVNLSQGEVDYAKPKVDAQFICMDIAEFLQQTPTASIDRIFAMNILEHLSKDELATVLEHSFRVLRPCGTLVAMVPNATSPFGAMTRYWDITHQLAFTPTSILQMMRLCGFSTAEFREWGPRPYSLVSTLRFLLWQVIRCLIAFRLLVETGSTKTGVYTADMLFRLKKDIATI